MKLSAHDTMHIACMHMRSGIQCVLLAMSHDTASVSRMQNPSKGLGEIITGVNNPRNEGQSCITSFFPVLHSEVLNIDMAGSFGGDKSIHHVKIDYHSKV